MPTSSKRGLGRGLGALLPPGVPAALAPGVREIDVHAIVPNPRQPRHKINPKDVRELAGLARVPVIVRGATGEEMLELALVENIQRSDLNALEEANAYKHLMDDFG